ncbi:TonB-dependent receptor [Acidobacteria bacterium AH-259-D05]|nr:TonB-dependent receptor [Acidobacteria bacterium AH-259-D05]
MSTTKTRKIWVFLILAFVFLAFHSHDLRAQVIGGTIAGTVKDQTDAVVPGVSVTLTNQRTGAVRTVVSNDTGRYRIPALDPGRYQIQAELPGFQVTTVQDIELNVADQLTIHLVLITGEITEEVVVTAAPTPVETTRVTLEGLVDDRQIRDLPLNGRSFTQLALLQEGVNAFRNKRVGFFGGRGLTFTVYGARFSQNGFLLDGTTVNDLYNNSPGSVAGVMLGVDTVEEFKVMTHNFSAEYGKAAGGVVNAVSRSGTNELHGSIFEFHRNDNLDAKNFFDAADEPIPEFKRNQFGFTLGGPIVKDKTFFFGSYEGLREQLGTTNVAFVPDGNARQGLLPGPDGALQDIGVDPDVAPYLAAYPLPNGRPVLSRSGNPTGISEFLFSFNQPANEDYFAIKVDHRFNDANSFFTRYTISDGEVTRLPGSTGLPNFIEPERSRNQYVTIEDKHIFSPGVLNTIRLGFNRSLSEVDDQPAAGTTPPPPYRPDLEIMGQLSVGGLTAMGTDFRVPIRNALNLYELADDLLITKGNHSLKMGFLGDMYLIGLSQWAQRNGAARFSDLQSFLEGTTSSFTQAVPGSDVDRSLQQFLFAFYIQDDFQWKPNLMLNLGLRYEPTTVPTERYNRIAGLPNPRSDPEMTIGPPNENPSLWNFMPRLGIAWDPFNNQKTSIRAGFGIFYDQIITGQYVPTISLIPPFYIRTSVRDGSFPDAFENFQRFEDILPNTWTPAPFDLSTPYIMQYNLSIDQEIFRNTLLRVGYAGSRGVKIARHVSANHYTPVEIVDGRFSVRRVPGRQRVNPNFGPGVSLRQYDANSFFHSLMVRLNRRFEDGLNFQVSYTLGKSLDDHSQMNSSDAANSSLSVQNPFDRKAGRGRSNHDVRQNLTINYGWELPFGRGKAIGSDLEGVANALIGGWKLNGIMELSSGNPFTVTVSGGSRFNNCSCGTLYPDLIPGGDNNRILEEPDKWFDASQFVLPDPRFFGSVARNSLQGPGLANFDFSLAKLTSLREEVGLEFRAEFFNIFNHPNFRTPAARVLSSRGPIPTAGRISSTVNTSRQIQFALKLTF